MLTAGVTLISNGTATGTAQQWPGGKGYFSVAASNFGGSTIKLQVLGPDGASWFDEGAGTTKTAAGGGVFDLPPCEIRAAVTGGPPTAAYAVAARVPY